MYLTTLYSYTYACTPPRAYYPSPSRLSGLAPPFQCPSKIVKSSPVHMSMCVCMCAYVRGMWRLGHRTAPSTAESYLASSRLPICRDWQDAEQRPMPGLAATSPLGSHYAGESRHMDIREVGTGEPAHKDAHGCSRRRKHGANAHRGEREPNTGAHNQSANVAEQAKFRAETRARKDAPHRGWGAQRYLFLKPYFLRS